MALPQTLAPGTPLNSDPKSEGAEQIRNLKQFIADVFGVPSNTPITAAPFAITASGAVTFGDAGYAPNPTYDNLVIGAPTGTIGLSFLNGEPTGAAGIVWGRPGQTTSGALTYTHSDLHLRLIAEREIRFNRVSYNHGMTSLADTSTVLAFNRDGAVNGEIYGYGLGGVGLELQGISASPDISHGASSSGAITLTGRKKSGTTDAALTGDDHVVVMTRGDLTNATHIFDASGDIHLDGVSNDNVYDAYNDAMLLAVARASLMPDCDYKAALSDWTAAYAPVLAQAGIITYNDDGHHFISLKGITFLMIDAIRQLNERIEERRWSRRICRRLNSFARPLRRLLPSLKIASKIDSV